MDRAARALARNSPFSASGDEFNRPDGAILKVTDTGEEWKGTAGSYIFQTYSGGAKCVTEGSTNRVAYFPSAVDVRVRGKFSAWDSAGAGDKQGLVARYVDASNFYLAVFTNTQILIRKRVSNTFTTLASAPYVGTAPGPADELYFLCNGDYIEAGVGNTVCSATDSTHSTNLVGFYINSTAVVCDSIFAEPLMVETMSDFDFHADFSAPLKPQYFRVHHPEVITVVDDPILGSVRKVVKGEPPNDLVGPTENPRIQLSPTRLLGADMVVWGGFSFMIPSVGFPASMPTGSSGWCNFIQLYAPNAEGSAPWKIGMRSGHARRLCWQRNETYGNDIPWEMPADMAYDVWHDFVVRIKMSNDPTVGSVEMWLDTGSGWIKQSYADGSTTMMTRTYDQGVNLYLPLTLELQIYRKKSMGGDWDNPVTAYHAHHALGHSFASVMPSTYGHAAPPGV